MTVHLSTTNFRRLGKAGYRAVVLFVVVFLLLDHGISAVLGRLYQNVYSGPGRYNFFIQSNPECIILGSSRSTCYYSDILSRKLGMDVLNVGLDGSALIYSRSLLEVFINKDNLKLVILNIDLFEFTKQAWSGNFYSMIEKLAPLYGRYEFVDSALEKGSFWEKLKYTVSSYRYNDLVLTILYKNLSGRREYKREMSPATNIKLPIDPVTMKEKFSDEIDIDSRKKVLLENLIDACREKNVEIVLVVSPLYYPDKKVTDRDAHLENYVQSIAENEDVPFIKITQDTFPEFRDHRLFKDVWHLNHRGSELFSARLADQLLKTENLTR